MRLTSTSWNIAARRTGELYMRTILLSLFALLFATSMALAAEETKKKAKPTEAIRTGTIANYGSYRQRAAINSASNSVPSEDLPNPISGSITRNRGGKCDATLTNRSEKYSYSVGFRVIGASKAGSEMFRRSFSARLSPGGSTTRTVACKKGYNMSIEIVSGKQLKK